MSIAALIRSMATAGASPEAIALAVEAVEAAEGKVEAVRTAARERKRRQREKGVTVTGQSRDAGGTVTVETPSLPSSPQTPQQPTHPPVDITTREASGEKPTTVKARPIPPDWRPSKPDLDYAASKGLTPQETERAAEDFRDYFVAAGAGKRSTDWSLNWKRWVRTTVDDQPRRGSGAPSRQAAGGQRPKPVSMAGILAERRGHAPVADDVPDDGWLLRAG